MTPAAAPPRHPKLVLIDGANAFYRAFFAIPGLRSPDGEPTNAIYGFATMLGKLLREERPDFVAVAFDPRGGSFRNQLYPAYKAGRDAQPEDLSAQIPGVREVIDAYGIALLEVQGFEADDVIATVVEKAPDDLQVVIVSSDKDLLQLVSDRVTMVDGIKNRRFGPAEVEERFGVGPERVLDLRALVGDPSDNIPGVKGIGEKGAAKLIAEWGTLENLLEHAADVKAKRAREALLTRAAEARLSKQLSTLRSDVPLPELEALACQAPDSARLAEIYRRLGFTRLLDALELEGASSGEASAAPEEIAVETVVVADAPSLAALREELAAQRELTLAAVIGAGNAVDAPLLGLAIACSDDRAAYLPLADGAAQQPELGVPVPPALPAADLAGMLLDLLGSGERSWAAVDAKRIQSALAVRGADLPPPSADPGLAAFLLDPAAARDLASVVQRRLGRRIDGWQDLVGRGAKAVEPREIEVERAAQWAGAQACAARCLLPELREQLERDQLVPLFDQIEMPLVRVLSRLERAGVCIDVDRLASLSTGYEGQLAVLEKEIHQLAGEEFLVSSPKQLQHILFEKLHLSRGKKTKTGYSTAEDVLEHLAANHPLPERVLAWRRLAKLKNTYLDALPPLVSPSSGRLHATFLQDGAATGRLASTRPNVQNIPIRTEEGIRIREAFVAAEGCLLLSADYSQIELRILAHYSEDASLVDAFQNGEDIHCRTAAEIAGIAPEDVTPEQRARAKAVNFGIIYGSSAFGLSRQLGIAGADAQETIDAYFDRYRGVRRFLDETVSNAREKGFVTTLRERRRYLPDLRSRNRVLRQAAERMAVNTVIQGSEADLIKQAMVDLDAALVGSGLGARMILQVHDELVFEAPRDEVDALGRLARERMVSVAQLRVPLEVDVGVGQNWREAH